MIMAAQEQALSPRAIEARIVHTKPDPRCSLCREAPQAGWGRLAGTAEMEHPYRVAGVAHRIICTKVGLEGGHTSKGAGERPVEEYQGLRELLVVPSAPWSLITPSTNNPKNNISDLYTDNYNK